MALRLGTVLICVLLTGCGPRESARNAALPEFVGGAACASCHGDVAAAWRGSHHDLAMQPAGPDTVLGDFGGTQFEYNGIVSRFFIRDGSYWVATDGANGTLQEFEVAYTFGVEPLQQYLLPLPRGRLQALSIAWDTRAAEAGGQRWFHLYPDDKVDHLDPLHWTGTYQNWNTMCAECHSTGLDKNYSSADDSYATAWTSLDVDCEACHGPGSLHATAPADHALALAGASRVWAFEPDRATARAASPAGAAEIEVCAQCHARRAQLDDAFLPGAAWLDSFRPALLEPELYHADGQILDEVYVYGSFVQSAMYAAGVTCSDCHDPHTAELRVSGNALCAQCHEAGVFDSAAHHGHETGTPAAECVACHMPERTYMVVDPRRDHSFRIPRPDLSIALNAPNACTQCHTDQTAAWAAAALAKRPGTRGGEFHFGQALAAGRQWSADRVPLLERVIADVGQPGIARATALGLLAQQSDEALLSAVERSLASADTLVQLAALDSVASVPPQYRADLAQRFLDAPLEAHRLAAARSLVGVRAQLSAQRQQDLDAALDEYAQVQDFNSDRPEGLLNLALLHAERGRFADAEATLRTAIEREPAFTASYVNLADLLRSQGMQARALELLEAAAGQHPDDAGIAFALGLALVRADRDEAALGALLRATELAPATPYYAYVYGIALNSTGAGDAALAALQTARQRFPGYAQLTFALATIHRDRGDAARALEFARQLLALLPGDARALGLVAELSP